MGILTTIADGLANVISGRGTTADKSVFNRWYADCMTPDQIEAAYRTSWLIRQIIDIPAQDQTRAGRDWDADDEEISKIEAEEKRLGYWQKVRQALTYGRLGGGALFINLGDDPSSPLPGTIKTEQIVSLIPLYRTELTIGQRIDDVLDPLFREPQDFRLNTARQPIIHPSRLIIFKGKLVPGFARADWQSQYWGDSYVQSVNESVVNATTATAGFAGLIDEAKVDVFFIENIAQILSQPDGEAKLRQRIDLATVEKSNNRSVTLGGNDRWETRQINWAGMPDVIKTYLSIVAGAADIPATRLLGKSPDGLNATGDGDLTNYFQSISAQQESELRPALDRLDAVVMPSAGVSTDLSWKFSPLQHLSEKDEADVENKEADSISKIVATGLIPERPLAKAVQNRLIESGRFPGLKEALDAEESDDGEDGDESELGIVPTGAEGGDPSSAGGGTQEPARRAANDAAPRTLYVSRKVQNVEALKSWATAQGLPDLQDDLHVTIAYSTTPVDWIKMGASWADYEGKGAGNMVITAGGPRVVEPLGDRTAVLMFASSDLSWRNREMREAGASWDWDDYQPHISLTGDPVDLAKVEPYRGKIVLGPEIFEEIRSGGE